MARQTLPEAQPRVSALRRIVTTSPLVLGVYAAASLALGYGFSNLTVDAVGLLSTAGGYFAGDAGIRKVTSALDGLA